VELWVASSDTDADVFVYLEDYDPAADVARYVTEGNFRASHRKTYTSPPAGDPRAAAHLPGQQVQGVVDMFYNSTGCHLRKG
jgi:predicted acyl esterase